MLSLVQTHVGTKIKPILRIGLKCFLPCDQYACQNHSGYHRITLVFLRILGDNLLHLVVELFQQGHTGLARRNTTVRKTGRGRIPFVNPMYPIFQPRLGCGVFERNTFRCGLLNGFLQTSDGFDDGFIRKIAIFRHVQFQQGYWRGTIPSKKGGRHFLIVRCCWFIAYDESINAFDSCYTECKL